MTKLLMIAVFYVFIYMCNTQQYSSRFDNFNVDEILNNDRVLNNYLKCLLDKGPCTQEGKELKKNLPEAIKTDCSKCTEKQVETTNRVVKFIRERKPKIWTEFKNKYDPVGQFEGRYLAGNL